MDVLRALYFLSCSLSLSQTFYINKNNEKPRRSSNTHDLSSISIITGSTRHVLSFLLNNHFSPPPPSPLCLLFSQLGIAGHSTQRAQSCLVFYTSHVEVGSRRGRGGEEVDIGDWESIRVKSLVDEAASFISYIPQPIPSLQAPKFPKHSHLILLLA